MFLYNKEGKTECKQKHWRIVGGKIVSKTHARATRGRSVVDKVLCMPFHNVRMCTTYIPVRTYNVYTCSTHTDYLYTYVAVTAVLPTDFYTFGRTKLKTWPSNTYKSRSQDMNTAFGPLLSMFWLLFMHGPCQPTLSPLQYISNPLHVWTPLVS